MEIYPVIFDPISDTFSHKALVSRVVAVFLDVRKIPAARIICPDMNHEHTRIHLVCKVLSSNQLLS